MWKGNEGKDDVKAENSISAIHSNPHHNNQANAKDGSEHVVQEEIGRG